MVAGKGCWCNLQEDEKEVQILINTDCVTSKAVHKPICMLKVGAGKWKTEKEFDIVKCLH